MDMHDPRLPQIGRRRDSRLRVTLPTRLVLLDGHMRAVLCDLSQSGARLRLERDLPIGEDAMLFWLHFEVFGRIVWATRKQAGIEFDEMIAPATLITTRDIADRGLSADEKQQVLEAARVWSSGYN